MIEIRRAQRAQDGPILIFGLAEAPDGTGWSLILQTDRGDMGRYSVSTADGATSYDAIESWRTRNNVLKLRLTREGADALALPQDLALRLDPKYVDEGEVSVALRDIANPS